MNFFSKNQNQELKYLMEACSLGFEDAINNIKRLPQHKIFAEELTKIYLNNLEDLKHHSQAKPKPGC